MATIFDYIYWRGNIPVSFDRLNEVDGLILTRFAYLPFELVERESAETVGSLTKKLEAVPNDELRLEEDARLIHALQTAGRFKDLKVTNFVKDNDPDRVKQFCALTVHLDEETMYIAFCGTDSSLVGWKEDFYMSFMEDVPAQKSAVEYVRQIAGEYPGKKFYLGGHSKGGNLAVYAAVNLEDALRERIVHVSDYDGPGFPKSYIASHDFASVLDRIATFIPQESVFGRIHDHAEGFSVVSSTEHGLYQHNPYSWEVEPTGLLLLPEADPASDVMYEAIQNMLERTEPEQRKQFVDEVYNIVATADFTSMKEFRQADMSQVLEVGKNVFNLSGDVWKGAFEMNEAGVKSLLEAVVTTMESELTSKLPLPNIPGILPEK